MSDVNTSNFPNPEKPAELAAALAKVGTVEVPLTVLPTKKAYFMAGGVGTYIMANGTKVVFRPGVVPGVPEAAFVTDIAGYIAELDRQIERGHEVLHTVAGYETVDDAMLDPFDSVKKQAVADFMKSKEFTDYMKLQAGVGVPADSVTMQESKLTGLATTESISSAAADSTGGGVAAPVAFTLAGLKK